MAAGRVLVAAAGGGLGQVNQGPGPQVRVVGGVMRVEDPGQLLVGLVVTAGAERCGSAGELDLGQQQRQAPISRTRSAWTASSVAVAVSPRRPARTAWTSSAQAAHSGTASRRRCAWRIVVSGLPVGCGG